MLLQSRDIYDVDSGKAELFVDVNKSTNMVCMHVIQNGKTLLDKDVISVNDIYLKDLYAWCHELQIQTALEEKAVAKLRQLVNMTIDTKNYFDVRARLNEYLRYAQTPTCEGFLDNLRKAGYTEYLPLLEERMNRDIVFYTAEQMYEYLSAGCDLYDPVSWNYVFLYNEEGAVCVYNIPLAAAEQLAMDAKEQGEPWSALLSTGGYVYDTYAKASDEICRVLYGGLCETHWIDTDMFMERLALTQDNDRDAIELD